MNTFSTTHEVTKLNILHTTQFLGIGGLEKILFLLIKEQMKAGHHVELLVYDYEQAWVEYFRSEGIIVHSDFKKDRGYDRRIWQVLNGHIKNIDVLHTHDLNPLMYAVPLKILRKLKGRSFPRLIHTAHGMDHVSKRPRTKVYEKLCSFMTDVTIGVSPAIKEFYVRHLLLPAGQVLNINNGTLVEMKDFDRPAAKVTLAAQLKLDPKRPIWTCVARVLPLKNQKLLIEAARRRSGMQLLLIGPSGDNAYWKDITDQLPENVTMAGAQSRVNEILQGSDFFVSASCHEGIPVAALEAGALGLPCLLSDIPGHRVLQKTASREIAEFFENKDLNDLIEKMDRLEGRSAHAATIGKNFQLHIKDSFSSEMMYHQYLKAYSSGLC